MCCSLYIFNIGVYTGIGCKQNFLRTSNHTFTGLKCNFVTDSDILHSISISICLYIQTCEQRLAIYQVGHESLAVFLASTELLFFIPKILNYKIVLFSL